MMLQLLEWSGAILGLLGAGLLALNTRHSGYGFVAFLLSNCCWIGFGLLSGSYGLLTMQAGFTVTSAIGVYRWLYKPPLPCPTPATESLKD